MRSSLLLALSLWLLAACSQGSTEREAPQPAAPTTAEVVAAWSPPSGPPSGSVVAQYGQLRVEGTLLVAEDGSPVQLKGVSSMWLNWDAKGYALDKDGMQFMRDHWGLQVFRAAMGVSEAGGYLFSKPLALAQVRRIVQNAIDLGVYVIVDFHEHEATKHPEVAEEFFTTITAEFGQYPNVLYEPFNEPLIVSWSNVLKPYHERVIQTIRAGDPDSVIILGTPQWSQLVDEASLDPIDESNLMYTLHFYACTHTQWLRDKADAALGRGLPLFVTEWGATHADGGLDGAVCEDEARAWLAWMDTHSISWAAWKYDGCNDSSCLFKDRTVPTSGGWSAEMLNGHAPLVIEGMQN